MIVNQIELICKIVMVLIKVMQMDKHIRGLNQSIKNRSGSN